MKQPQLSTGKRFGKPILFGALLLGLATAFINRHWFFQDLGELRAQKQAKYDSKLMEVMDQRQRQLAEVERKKGGT